MYRSYEFSPSTFSPASVHSPNIFTKALVVNNSDLSPKNITIFTVINNVSGVYLLLLIDNCNCHCQVILI